MFAPQSDGRLGNRIRAAFANLTVAVTRSRSRLRKTENSWELHSRYL